MYIQAGQGVRFVSTATRVLRVVTSVLQRERKVEGELGACHQGPRSARGLEELGGMVSLHQNQDVFKLSILTALLFLGAPSLTSAAFPSCRCSAHYTLSASVGTSF